MTKEMFMDLARTLLKAAGGYMASHGVLTGSDADTIIGGLVVVAGLLWSWWSTRNFETKGA